MSEQGSQIAISISSQVPRLSCKRVSIRRRLVVVHLLVKKTSCAQLFCSYHKRWSFTSEILSILWSHHLIPKVCPLSSMMQSINHTTPFTLRDHFHKFSTQVMAAIWTSHDIPQTFWRSSNSRKMTLPPTTFLNTTQWSHVMLSIIPKEPKTQLSLSNSQLMVPRTVSIPKNISLIAIGKSQM